MTGFEITPILKVMPLAGVILAAAIGYGQIQADLKNLQETQKAQFIMIQSQLTQISDRLNNDK
jgi:hypothetical protein